MSTDAERTQQAESDLVGLLTELDKHDVVALVQSPIYGEALHFMDGKLCACSHGLKCGPLDDKPNTVIPDVE